MDLSLLRPTSCVGNTPLDQGILKVASRNEERGDFDEEDQIYGSPDHERSAPGRRRDCTGRSVSGARDQHGDIPRGYPLPRLLQSANTWHGHQTSGNIWQLTAEFGIAKAGHLVSLLACRVGHRVDVGWDWSGCENEAVLNVGSDKWDC